MTSSANNLTASRNCGKVSVGTGGRCAPSENDALVEDWLKLTGDGAPLTPPDQGVPEALGET